MTSLLAHYGVPVILVMMAIDAVFPAASELVMVYAGALASGALVHQVHIFGWDASGFAAFLVVVAAGIVGYQVGAVFGWWIGDRGGRPFLEDHGRWFHLSEAKLDRAERWFRRHDTWAVLLGRMTPLVRSFVSIPAGVFETPFHRYNVLTLIGNAVWCVVFASIGWALGASWDSFQHGFRFVDYVVIVAVGAAALLLVARLRRRSRGTISES
ncbi:MAG TPA: DedA family protein [Gaiellaceae bacterium]